MKAELGTGEAMKTLIIGVALAALAVTPAMAADIPVKAPPVVPAPLYTWTGFYLGTHTGYGWSDLDWVDSFATDLSHKGRGFMGGAQAGFNWQWNNFVAGVEVDGDVTDIDGRRACPNPAFSCKHDIKSLWTARARLGVLFGPMQQFLVYGTGGGAWGKVDYEARAIATGSLVGGFQTSARHGGWVGGGGVEWKFAPNLSVKAEYLRYGLGSERKDCSPSPAVGTIFCTWKPEIDVVKVGFNWHFGAPAAVVARY